MASEPSSPAKPGLATRAARRVLTISLTLATVAGAIGLVYLASGWIAANAARGDGQEEVQAAAVPVETQVLKLQAGYETEVEVLGRIEAGRSAILGFEAGGTLAEVLVDEGDIVSKGQVLAMLNTDALEAERLALLAGRDSATSARDLAALTANRQQALVEKDFASTQRFDEARLGLAQADAQLRQIEAQLVSLDVQIAKSTLSAPFDGRISARFVDEGARLGGGTPVLQMLESGATIFRAGLPPEMADGLTLGQTATLKIGGQMLEGRLTRIRPDIDAATRTVDAHFAISEAANLRSGTLGHIIVTQKVNGAGAWVPLTAVGEGIRGLWTVFLVEPSEGGNVVRNEAVELIYADETRAFVRGNLPDGAQFVSHGLHRITSGQALTTLPEEG